MLTLATRSIVCLILESIRNKETIGSYILSGGVVYRHPYDQNSLIVRRRGFSSVFKKARSRFYKGTIRYSTKRRNYLVYRFRGNKVTLIATKGKYRSKARIYVDGKHKKTIDTKSSRIRYRREVYRFRWSKKSTHKLKIVNLATKGRPRLDLDGLAVRR